MARSHRKRSNSRRDEESSSSYSDSRSRSRSRGSRRYHSRQSERKSHSSRHERRHRSRSRSVSSESSSEQHHQRNKRSDDYFPKATVTEVGGEISCSIEETNRIRAELGLPPLEVDNEEETKTEDGVVIVDMDKQRREAAIREKLEKSRRERERLALQNLEGKGLGDLLTEETKELDVKQWLESSKSKQEKALEEMEEEEEKKEEEKNRLKETTGSLAGMKVAHDITQIGEGDTILTLRDAPLIDANGNINEDEDILENIDLVAKEKQKEINKLREKAKLPVYSGLDDHEFDSDYDEEDRFLPQYADKKKKKEAFFTLTETGVSEADLEKSKMMAKQRVKESAINPLSTALSPTTPATEKKSLSTLLSSITSEKKIASEYYTNEEMAQFKKKRKRVRKVRPIEKEEVQLEEVADEEMTNRKRIRTTNQEAEDEKKEREAGYQRAKAKEEIKNRGLSKKGAGSISPIEEVFDDPLLSDTLLRARKVVLGQRKQTIQEIAERIQKEREEEGIEEEEQQSTGLEAVSEFSKRFKTIMNERKKEKEEEVKKVVVESTPAVEPEKAEPEPESEPIQETKDKEKLEQESEDDFYEQPNISVGLGSVLAYLKSQNVTDTREEAYGRRTDNVIDTHNTEDGFVIEHRDKDGRLLTTKEAFRQLSYQFHGKTPGQKNKSRKNAKYTKGLANKGIYSYV